MLKQHDPDSKGVSFQTFKSIVLSGLKNSTNKDQTPSELVQLVARKSQYRPDPDADADPEA